MLHWTWWLLTLALQGRFIELCSQIYMPPAISACMTSWNYTIIEMHTWAYKISSYDLKMWSIWSVHACTSFLLKGACMNKYCDLNKSDKVSITIFLFGNWSHITLPIVSPKMFFKQNEKNYLLIQLRCFYRDWLLDLNKWDMCKSESSKVTKAEPSCLILWQLVANLKLFKLQLTSS